LGDQLPILQRVEIASPCPARWADMAGDDRVRFCEQCSLHVYNLAAMPAAEAETLIRRTEGRLCARVYRRADGTILTSDCPVGVRVVRQRMMRAVRRAAGAVLVAVGLCVGMAVGNRGGSRPFATLRSWLIREPVAWVMGAIVVRPAQTPPSHGDSTE